ncbi:hypothetical protein MHU86_12427 [Fragilaria crotonensis]|nr:hypothetical protein MHU86_12427 [Fragilaria crotonensis]
MERLASNQHRPKGQGFILLSFFMFGLGYFFGRFYGDDVNSEIAKRLWVLQRNCSLPVKNYVWRAHWGLGSDLHVWSNQLWGAMLDSHRVKAPYPWAWKDTSVCGQNSTWLCYFPAAEASCPGEIVLPGLQNERWSGIPRKNAEYNVTEFRAGATEFLFSSVSQVVIHEAERQLHSVFGEKGVPPNLITMNIRWGDKSAEGAATVISDFVTAIETIVKEKNLDSVHILLCTEDPIAEKAFRLAAHPSWKIYMDQYYTEYLPFRMNRTELYNAHAFITADLNGKPGLWALGSLLVAMEANYFVLTTISNWSRLMNELRKNVVNPRCGNCTYMIDLQAGEC